jgi:hypothetical protein
MVAVGSLFGRGGDVIGRAISEAAIGPAPTPFLADAVGDPTTL